ncbi:hypothetical protein T484DRAFT_1908055 [Baffinella frigidus]|nr:hypothetical protein T484DRAFT_1908055 [Cryptophyta sp. CCMP2293]
MAHGVRTRGPKTVGWAAELEGCAHGGARPAGEDAPCHRGLVAKGNAPPSHPSMQHARSRGMALLGDGGAAKRRLGEVEGENRALRERVRQAALEKARGGGGVGGRGSGETEAELYLLQVEVRRLRGVRQEMEDATLLLGHLLSSLPHPHPTTTPTTLSLPLPDAAYPAFAPLAMTSKPAPFPPSGPSGGSGSPPEARTRSVSPPSSSLSGERARSYSPSGRARGGVGGGKGGGRKGGLVELVEEVEVEVGRRVRDAESRAERAEAGEARAVIAQRRAVAEMEGRCRGEGEAWRRREADLAFQMEEGEHARGQERQAHRTLSNLNLALQRRAAAAEAKLAQLHAGLAAMGEEP